MFPWPTLDRLICEDQFHNLQPTCCTVFACINDFNAQSSEYFPPTANVLSFEAWLEHLWGRPRSQVLTWTSPRDVAVRGLSSASTDASQILRNPKVKEGKTDGIDVNWWSECLICGSFYVMFSFTTQTWQEWIPWLDSKNATTSTSEGANCGSQEYCVVMLRLFFVMFFPKET